MSVNYHSLRIPLHRLAPVRTLIKDSSLSAGCAGCIPRPPGRSFSHGLVASIPLSGSTASSRRLQAGWPSGDVASAWRRPKTSVRPDRDRMPSARVISTALYVQALQQDGATQMPPLALIGGYVPTNPPPIAVRKVGKFTHLSHGTKVLLLNNTRTL